jgi:DNA-directed RNA polymerase specialized sigma24 family protein
MDPGSLICRYIYQELVKRRVAVSSTAFRDVVADAARGDVLAWRALYRDLAPAVVGYVGAVGGPDGAVAGVGRVFTQLGGILHSFKGGERDLRRVVFSIAHGEAKQRSSRLGPRAHLGPLGSIQLAPGELRVRRVVDTLPRDEREALLLCVLGELSAEEAARILEAPAGAVADLVRRSLVAIAGEISSAATEASVTKALATLSRDEVEQLIAGRGEGKAQLDELRVFLISLKFAFFAVPSEDAESRHVRMAVSAARSTTAPATHRPRGQATAP